MLTDSQRKDFAALLDIVALELTVYAANVRLGNELNWDQSTYGLAAQAAVYDLMRADHRL